MAAGWIRVGGDDGKRGIDMMLAYMWEMGWGDITESALAGLPYWCAEGILDFFGAIISYMHEYHDLFLVVLLPLLGLKFIPVAVRWIKRAIGR